MDRPTRTRLDHLTETQARILALVAQGRTNAQIGAELGLSLDGAKYHVTEILNKLGVDSREQAAALWDESRRGSAMRAFRAVVSLPLWARLGLGAGAAVAVAGAGAIAVRPMVTQGPLPPPAATTSAAPGDPVSPVFVLATATRSDGERAVLKAWRTAGGLCTSAGPDTGVADPAAGATCILPAPDILGGSTIYSPAGGGYREFQAIGGSLPGSALRVQIALRDGRIVEPPIVQAPPALGVDFAFYLHVLEEGERVLAARVFAADGSVIAATPTYDDAYTYASPPAPPVEQFDAAGWGGLGQPAASPDVSAFSVPPGQHRYWFEAQHNGNQPIRFIRWCRSGVLEPVYTSGPDARGNGTFYVDVPEGAFHCRVQFTQVDGLARVRSVPAP